MTFFGSSSGSSSSSAVTSPSTSMTPENLCQAIREENYARIIDIIFDHPEFAGEKFEEENQTAIALAIALGDFTAQRLLLRCNLNPQLLDKLDSKKLYNSTPSLNTHEDEENCIQVLTTLYTANERNDHERMINILFDHPELCNVAIRNGKTQDPILKTAVLEKKLTLIKLLLLFLTTIDIKDENNKTPLYWAVLHYIEAPIESLEIIRLLIEKGANPDVDCASHQCFETTPRLLATRTLPNDMEKILAIFDQTSKKQPHTLQRCSSQLLSEIANKFDFQQSSKKAIKLKLPVCYNRSRHNSL